MTNYITDSQGVTTEYGADFIVDSTGFTFTKDQTSLQLDMLYEDDSNDIDVANSITELETALTWFN